MTSWPGVARYQNRERSRILDPHLPSFTLALSRSAQYPLRLPAYRSSYQLRYHPYAGHPSFRHDNLTVDVGYRSGDHNSITVMGDETTVDLKSIREDDTTAADLAEAMFAGSNCGPAHRGRRLSLLIIDLAFMVRIQYVIRSSRPKSTEDD